MWKLINRLFNRHKVKRGIKEELIDVYGLTKKEAKWIIQHTDSRDLLKIDLQSGDLNSIEDWAQDLNEEFDEEKYG